MADPPRAAAAAVAAAAADMPRDAKVVVRILNSMGVHDFEPRVVNQFLELMHRYIGDVVSEARVYSEHASKNGVIDVDDVRLAIQSCVNFSFTQPPPREILMELARERNSLPLPPLVSGPGIPLPPEAEALVSSNYQIHIPSRSARARQDEEFDDDDVEAGTPRAQQKRKDTASATLEEPQVAGGDASRKVSFSIAAKKPKP